MLWVLATIKDMFIYIIFDKILLLIYRLIDPFLDLTAVIYDQFLEQTI